MIEGHGNLKHNLPSTLFPINSFPLSSSNTGCTPGKGNVANPGFVFVIPASGEIIIPPVSVCHHVSTIGQFFFPMFSLYQFHAATLVGSPTVPSTRKELNLYGFTKSNPIASSERIAVGAV